MMEKKEKKNEKKKRYEMDESHENYTLKRQIERDGGMDR